MSSAASRSIAHLYLNNDDTLELTAKMLGIAPDVLRQSLLDEAVGRPPLAANAH